MQCPGYALAKASVRGDFSTGASAMEEVYDGAGALGSMVNTIFVMLFIYLLFRNEYSGSMKNPLPVEHLPMYIVGIIGTQGILEAVVSSLITFAVSNALIKYKNSI